jgi:hypothetical protein
MPLGSGLACNQEGRLLVEARTEMSGPVLKQAMGKPAGNCLHLREYRTFEECRLLHT